MTSMSEVDQTTLRTATRVLGERNLFVLDHRAEATHHIIYAPLADAAFVATDQDIAALALAAENGGDEGESEYTETLRTLTEVTPVDEREGYVHDERDFVNLSLLPNNTCNFACSYCYSAHGRSTARIDWDRVKTTIDYFLDMPRRELPPLLTVSIFGGGEPMLSWNDVVRPAIEYIHSRPRPEGQRVVVTMITNGSIVTDEMMDLCLRHGIDLAVSFDILEDVQQAQRRHYALVCQNLRRLIDRGIVPAINAVVTELNVNRQEEMVETLHRHFPEVKYVSFEPVIGEVKNRREFYDHVAQNFVRALDKAQALGMRLSCTALRNVDVSVDRYCAGEFALCADGSISVCPCVSSSQEPNYHRYVYGCVDGEGVHVDGKKLQNLLGKRVHSNAWCQHCFAKWNCGGGCMNTNICNGGKQDIDYCHFTRWMTRHFIYTRLAKTYREEYNEDLTQEINEHDYLIR